MNEKQLGSALVIIIGLFGLNWVSVWAFEYPFLYCWMPYLIPEWLIGYIRAGFVIAIMVTAVYWLLTKKAAPFVQVAVAMVVVYTIPAWYMTLTNLGGSCG